MMNKLLFSSTWNYKILMFSYKLNDWVKKKNQNMFEMVGSLLLLFYIVYFVFGFFIFNIVFFFQRKLMQSKNDQDHISQYQNSNLHNIWCFIIFFQIVHLHTRSTVVIQQVKIPTRHQTRLTLTVRLAAHLIKIALVLDTSHQKENVLWPNTTS